MLVVRHKRALEGLADVSKRYEQETGLHVDFSRPLTVADVRRWPHWLMWYDVLNGHVVLDGPDRILLDNAPQSLERPLPPLEAVRLLLNRGTGLLWAQAIEQGARPQLDGDFIRRNYYKCALALGDALLIAHRRYTTPYEGRDTKVADLVQNLEAFAGRGLEALYAKALVFKFSPDEIPPENLDAKQLTILAQHWGEVFLHIERRRFGREWTDLAGYASWDGQREDEEHTLFKRLRNLAINGRVGRLSSTYPREQLYRQLPVLLGLTENQVKDWPSAVDRYLATWSRVG